MKLEYPKNLTDNMKFRMQILTEGEKDPIFAKAIREICAKDILFWFNVFGWAYDPLRWRDGKDRPVITYEYQDRVILQINDWIESGENGFIDKARDMFVSYMVDYVFLWRFLYKDGEEFKIGSRTQEEVDKSGNMGTHFEKLRYQLHKLPLWLMPFGWDWGKHSTYMRLVNVEKGNAIIGESTNENFARGDRKKAILYDEFQSWECAEEAWAVGSDSTKCKIAVGTPKGSGNKFAELSRTDEVKNKLHLDWWLHPQKVGTTSAYLEKVKKGEVFDRVRGHKVEVALDQSKAPLGCYICTCGQFHSEWYDKECSERDVTNIRENLDRNYITTGNPVFDQVVVRQRMVDCKPMVAFGNLHWKVRPIYDSFGNCINKDALDVEFVPSFNGIWKLWEYPLSGWENGYLLSADVAEGLEQGDYDSASVIRRFPKQGETLGQYHPTMVATLHGHLKTFEYKDELVKCAVYYKRCWIIPERNGLGLAVVEGLWDIYPKIYHQDILTMGYPEKSDKIGWSTTGQTKPTIINNLSRAISLAEFEDNDEGFWKECTTFVNDDGTLEAQGKSRGERCFDDKVMDRAILLWCHKELPAPTRKREEVQDYKWKQSWNKRFSNKNLIRFAVQ